jgi:hypothetical protein
MDSAAQGRGVQLFSVTVVAAMRLLVIIPATFAQQPDRCPRNLSLD